MKDGDGRAGLTAAIENYILNYFERPNAEPLSGACLVERFNEQDPDAFTEFLEDFSRKFKISVPQAKNPGKYYLALKKSKFFGGACSFRRTQESAVLYVDELYFEELCQIAYAKQWPLKYALCAEALA
ncbi:MAG: hypothetical protein CMI63_01335 [Parvularcula sp.]|nr:hypothetical protein [Parvularcula sp.]|tara:strand:- start:44 stop:427 length:384 start_codon:yes stop_codon:yes gene_type:complete